MLGEQLLLLLLEVLLLLLQVRLLVFAFSKELLRLFLLPLELFHVHLRLRVHAVCALTGTKARSVGNGLRYLVRVVLEPVCFDESVVEDNFGRPTGIVGCCPRVILDDGQMLVGLH